MKNLIEIVEAAVSRKGVTGITGWGLGNPNDELFEEFEIGESVGCTSETCNNVSHDPAAPTVKLIQKAGQLVDLGQDSEANYYGLVIGDDVRFLRLTSSRAYWDSIRLVEEVPDWALLKLVEK